MDSLFIRPLKKTPLGNPLQSLPALFEAALTEFAARSFDSASLNDIIRSSGISKGSFYHRFADKMDLYLCVMDMISQQKAAFISKTPPTAEGFFEQLRFLFRRSLEFALSEPRYDAFWRMYLAEASAVKDAVDRAFPGRGIEKLETLTITAIEKEPLHYPASFVIGIVKLLAGHLDTLIEPDMSHEDIAGLADNLVNMLKSGLANPPGSL